MKIMSTDRPSARHTWRPNRSAALVSACLGIMVVTTAPARADPLVDPPVFTANPATRTLNLLVVAKPKALSFPFGFKTTGWVYEICPRPANSPNACPAGTGVQPFGGARLALDRGDTLRIRLVNQLPVITDSKHCSEPGHADLVNNPTNIHTHGLIVDPHRATSARDFYGDYSFLEIRNPANAGTCLAPSAAQTAAAISTKPSAGICSANSRLGIPGALHPDMDVIDTAAEYAIPIPAQHPPGLFWMHPHMHGISMNQITSGLESLITVGTTADICADTLCRSEVGAGDVHFLTLQDMQVEPNGHLDDQQNAAYCTGSEDGQGGHIAQNPGYGSCFEVAKAGRWFHTINGQVYPSISVGASGSIWRMLNASPSRSYDLSLVATNASKIPMQILAIDGVAIDSNAPIASEVELVRALGPNVKTVACPTNASAGPRGVCVERFHFMPSARIEVRITNPSRSAQTAVFQTAEVFTGPVGDDWPTIYLASVNLAAPNAAALAPLNVGGTRALYSAAGALGQAALMQRAGAADLVPPETARASLAAASRGPILQGTLRQTRVYAIDPATATGGVNDDYCAPLQPGHRRRIYFGYIPAAPYFGLGYVEMDQTGKEVPGTAIPVSAYNPANTTICLPLAAGNKPVTEVWELINLTGEEHNFHIHQARFRVRAINGVPLAATEASVAHDNYPLGTGSAGCDGTLATAQAKGSTCHKTTTVVAITFSRSGDFLYHCHIMEHEDGGMMARIRVVPR